MSTALLIRATTISPLSGQHRPATDAPPAETGRDSEGPAAVVRVSETARELNARAVDEAFSRGASAETQNGALPRDPEEDGVIGGAEPEDDAVTGGRKPEDTAKLRGSKSDDDAEVRGAKPQEQLTPEEKEVVADLKSRDREVRAHEGAHKAAAGSLAAGAASFELESGPDGQSYAVGGEVNISVSEGRTPEETIAKAGRIRAAANAPAEPSGQDLSVAAQATQMEARARVEKSKSLAEDGVASAEAVRSTDSAETTASAAAEGLAAVPDEPLQTADKLPAAADELPAVDTPAEPEGAQVSFRAGGVGGGHAHPAQGCTVCGAGIKAYGGSPQVAA